VLLNIVSAFMKRLSGLHYFVILVLFGAIAILNSCGGGGGGGGFVLPPAASNSAGVMGVSAVAGDREVALGWSAVSNAATYKIYRSLVSGQSGTQIASVTAPVTSYINIGLTNNTTYYYRVDAVNGATDLGVSSQVSVTPISGTPVTITINGTVQYQDKEYGVNGFTGNQPYKAVRYAEVDLVPSSGSIISTVTDSNGMYTISTAPSTSISVYVRVKSTATIPGAAPIAVKSLSNALYGVASNNLTPSGNATVNISIPSTSIGGAFNMLDVFTNGFNFVYNLTSGTYPPSLNGFWEVNNSNGTYYCSEVGSGCPDGEGIYVLNSSSDTDEYDDDVLYHEFGHFTAQHFSQDDSTGGAHSLTDNDLDMRLAWSEGWGDAMPGNIKMWLNSTNPNLLSSSGVPLTEYVDTVSGGAGIAIDMDNPESSYPFIDPKDFSYACGEIAVAKILLDSNKTFGMQDVWNVIASYTTGDSPVSLETFWDRWNSKGYSSLQSIFSNRFIFYSDLYSDNTPGTAAFISLNTSITRNLYLAGDADYFAFSATSASQPFTITTSNLRNGADTIITLLNSDGTTLTPDTTPANPNDNANGTTYSVPSVPSGAYPRLLCDSYGICHDNGLDILGSRLTFAAANPGTYYVKIQSSPTRPVSAGRYGTYTLTITSP
jgi:Bacterial pre-peptidase C-terminal domain